MRKLQLNPLTPLDEIPGQVSGSVSQLNESIDKAQNHYQVFSDLGLTPENIAQPEAQKKMRLMHKTLRPELHPDKVFSKLQGGENEAEIAALRDLMQERFKKLQEAYEVLSDADKRQKYNHTLDNRVVYQFKAPEPAQDKEKKKDNPSCIGQIFQALVPLEDIEAQFKQFFKEMFGEDANLETEGFAFRYTTDPKTGQPMLELSFPNKDYAEQFINRLADLKMIDRPAQEAAPVAEQVDQDDDRNGYQLPQLKPSLKPEAA